MSVSVWNILDLDEAAGIEGINALVFDFSTRKAEGNDQLKELNPDIEVFLKNNALQFAGEKKSITYLVCDEDDSSLLGYFTITHKAIEVSPEGLSNSYIRRHERYAKLHADLNAYLVSGYLIAQLGKNYSVDSGERLSGDELMRLCFKELFELQHRLGGGLVYLDCEDRTQLIDFYEKKHRFRKFGERTSIGDGKRYLQYMRFL